MDGGEDGGGAWQEVGPRSRSRTPASSSSGDSGGPRVQGRRGRGRSCRGRIGLNRGEGQRRGSATPPSSTSSGPNREPGRIGRGSEQQLQGGATPPSTSTASAPSPSPSAVFPDFAELQTFRDTLTRKADAIIAHRFLKFLQRYNEKDDLLPYYAAEAKAIISRKGSCLRFWINFDHLKEGDMRLAFKICNDKVRLLPMLTKVVCQFFLNCCVQDDQTEETHEEKVRKHKTVIEHKVELVFLKMPNRISTLQEFLDQKKEAILEKVRIFTMLELLLPSRLGSAVFQLCLKHLIQNHIAGISWDGIWELSDWEVADNEVVLKIVGQCSASSDSRSKDLKRLFDLMRPYYEQEGKPSPLFFEQLRSDFTDTLETIVTEVQWEWFCKYMSNHVFLMTPLARLTLIKTLYSTIKTHGLSGDVEFFPVLNVEGKKIGDWTVLVKKLPEGSMLSKVLYHNVDKANGEEPRYNSSMGNLLNFLRNLIEHLDEHTRRGGRQTMRTILEPELYASFKFMEFLPAFLKTLLPVCKLRDEFNAAWEQFEVSGYLNSLSA